MPSGYGNNIPLPPVNHWIVNLPKEFVCIFATLYQDFFIKMKTPPQLSEAGLREIAKPNNLFPLAKKENSAPFAPDQLMRGGGLEAGLLHAADVFALAFGQSFRLGLRGFVCHYR